MKIIKSSKNSSFILMINHSVYDFIDLMELMNFLYYIKYPIKEVIFYFGSDVDVLEAESYLRIFYRDLEFTGVRFKKWTQFSSISDLGYCNESNK